MKQVKDALKKTKNHFLVLGLIFGVTLGVCLTGLIYRISLIHWVFIIGFASISIYFNRKITKFWNKLMENFNDK